MITFVVYTDFVFYPILVCGLSVIFFAILWIVQLVILKKKRKKFTQIWLSGLIGFIFGILGEIVMIKKALDDISKAGDISASLIAYAISQTIYLSFSGTIVLLLSLIFLFIFKSINNK